MNREEKQMVNSRMNKFANRFCRHNKVRELYTSSVYNLVRSAFKTAYFLCYKIFKQEEEFWKSRYWVLNDVYVKVSRKKELQLTKAKEILQLFLDANTPLDMINAQRRAEQFLKEIKEK